MLGRAGAFALTDYGAFGLDRIYRCSLLSLAGFEFRFKVAGGKASRDPRTGLGSCDAPAETVLALISEVLHIRMTLFPVRPSRLNVMSMPSGCRNVCAQMPLKRREDSTCRSS